MKKSMQEYADIINAARAKNDCNFVKGCSDFLVKTGFLTEAQVETLGKIEPKSAHWVNELENEDDDEDYDHHYGGDPMDYYD